jgi:hypothetical protein
VGLRSEGNFVFSVGSITFVGSLMIDDKLQTIVRHAVDAALAFQIPAVGAPGWTKTPASGIGDVAVDQNRLWVAGTNGTVWFSDDWGATFEATSASGFARLAVAGDGTLWTVGMNGTVWYLPAGDPAGAWQLTAASSIGDAAVALPSGRLWVAGTNGTIWFSDDGAGSFTRVDASGFGRLATAADGTLWAAGVNGTLWHRPATTNQWTRTSATMAKDVAVDQSTGRVLITCTDGTIAYTDDGGACFIPAGASGFGQIAASPDGSLFAVGNDGSLWRA